MCVWGMHGDACWHAHALAILRHAPLQTGDADAVAVLLAAGAPADAVAADGSTPLRRAALNGHAHVIAQLLEAGAALVMFGSDD